VAAIAGCGAAVLSLIGPGRLAAQAELRIEQEDKLLVPIEQAEEVWRFLHGWLVEDAEGLASLDPELRSTFNEELFSDTYFDSPGLTLLAREHGVRFRHRLNLTDPTDPKHGRSLIQIKLSGISDDALERGEFKFDPATPIDLSLPLLGIAKPSEREALRTRLVGLSVDPRSMRPIFTIRDLRHRIYLSRNSTPFLSVSHDHVTVKKLWATVEFVEIEPELNEVTYTDADPTTRAYMAAIGKRISDAILERFPDVRRDLTPKYGKAAAELEASIPGFRTLVRYDLHDGDGVAGLLVIGLGVMGSIGVMTVRGVRRLRGQSVGAPRARPDPA
jgi:hypothetical protein